MTDQSYVVTIVVDPTFGDQLRSFAADQPVWVVDTPVNRSVGEDIWRRHQGPVTNDGITLFKADPAEGPADWVAGVIPDVELHHGHYSHTPPYSAIEVIGSAVTTGIRDVLASYGLGNILERPGGFRASRHEPAA